MKPAEMTTVGANSLLLLRDGQEAWAALRALIDGAQHEIRMLYYIFEADAVGREMREALIAACRRGVKVWLTVDGFGSIATPTDFFAPLVAAGANFCRFEPHWGRRFLLRNHQKLTVIDKHSAIVGGFNIAAPYFDSGHPDSWRDLGLRLDGPAAAQLAGYHDQLFGWMTQRHPTIRALRRLMLRQARSDDPARWVISGPLRRASLYARQLRGDLNHARRLETIIGYFAPSRRILRLIGAVARRGSAVLIIPAKTDVPMSRLAAWATFDRLLADGVRIFEYRPKALHSKLIIIDDIVYIGSANLDMRSLYINLELMLRVEDADFANSARALFADELTHCREIDKATHAQAATWFNRLRWRCAYLILASLDLFVTRRLTS